ncbi:MAG: tRNA pseudouridine(55) synthase TruB [bacterium]
MISSIPSTFKYDSLPLHSAFDFERGVILNINKPAGWSSFDVVKKIRSQLNIRKVGHAGSLDPFATGVLLVCTGHATKKVEELMNCEKEYVACVEFGKTTDTFDCTGTISAGGSTLHLTFQSVANICRQFVGENLQIPPMFSALKVNGQRLYRLARKGQVIERKPRKIRIHSIDIMAFDNPFVTLKVVCSRGTYVRALANDIGEMLGCGGYLKELQRTKVGDYKLEDSLGISEFVRDAKSKKTP